jgi:hypothetical protein
VLVTQLEKGRAFRALHERSAFLIPNPWDVGTARLLAQVSSEALATTSAGYAFSVGQLYNAIHGTFAFARDAMNYRDFNAMLAHDTRGAGGSRTTKSDGKDRTA